MSRLSADQVAQIAMDLAPFADIGTDAPIVQDVTGGHVIRLVRMGEPTELSIKPSTGEIVELTAGETVKHINVRALLASDRYGSLRDWALRQRAFLGAERPPDQNLIEVTGILNGGFSAVRLSDIDNLLIASQKPDSTRVLLIDGPAGIGKTQFIVTLAAKRAHGFAADRRPLILHVQSRGRTLSYIYDLIAFSLQKLRIGVTFDQIPILAKYGLITIAIDGFDELADPDGYDLAWSQVSDLIATLRGSGSIILAGRETFIGRARIVKDIASLREDVDEISVLTLQPPSKGDALRWLAGQSWSPGQLDAVEAFLEPDSLALRPFFLKTLSDPSIAQQVSNTSATNILSILMDAMIEREITKFGEAVESELSKDQLRSYVREFMGEVARDMADNSTEAISDATLAWLVDVALPQNASDSTRRLLKARSQVLAFLTNDDRSGYRRFYHEKFFEYFLSIVLIDTVANGEISKPIARNILGSSFLETFGSVVSGGTATTKAAKFLEQALRIVSSVPPADRTSRNLSSLLLASLAVADLIEKFELSSVDIDEARFSGTAGVATLD